jgi:hypothetical protein
MQCRAIRVPEAGSVDATEALLHIDPSVAVLRPSSYVRKAEVFVDGEIFGHDLVGIERKSVEATFGGHTFCEIHEFAPSPDP